MGLVTKVYVKTNLKVNALKARKLSFWFVRAIRDKMLFKETTSAPVSLKKLQFCNKYSKKKKYIGDAAHRIHDKNNTENYFES